jgi:hypothetical protein
MFTTTIRSISIIWGKFLSGFIITCLFFSVSAPFMVLTYMLRGIDVPTIAIVLFIDFLTIVSAVQMTIALACGAKNLVSAAGIVVLCLIALPMVLVQIGQLTLIGIMGMGGGFFGATISGVTWLYILGMLGLLGCGHGGVMLAGAATISPPTSNRAFGLRLFLVCLWLVSGIICAITTASSLNTDWIFAWGVVSAWIGLLMLLVSICERDRWGPRVLAQVPRNRLLRPIAFLLFSGSAGGAILSLLVMIVSLIIPWVWLKAGSPLGGYDNAHGILLSCTTCAYVTAYALLGVFIVRYIGRGFIKTEATVAIALALMAGGTVAPMIVSYILNPNGNFEHGYLWRLGNPFAAQAGSASDYPFFLLVSLFAAGTMAALSTPWMIQQMRRFKPLKPVTTTGKALPEALPRDSAVAAVAPAAEDELS